jgi:hypothetical protein
MIYLIAMIEIDLAFGRTYGLSAIIGALLIQTGSDPWLSVSIAVRRRRRMQDPPDRIVPPGPKPRRWWAQKISCKDLENGCARGVPGIRQQESKAAEYREAAE